MARPRRDRRNASLQLPPRTFPTKQKADNWLRSYVKEDPSKAADARRMFAEIATAWLDEQRVRVLNMELAPSTYEQYRTMVDKHLVPSIGRREIGALDTKTLNEVALSAMKALPSRYAGKIESEVWYVPHGSLPKRRAILHAILGYAVEEGFIRSNPMADARRKRRTIRETRPQVGLTRKQFQALIAAAKGTPGELYVTLALNTGARPSELLALQWQDIDFTAKTINISASLGQIEIGGKKVRKALKTGASSRRAYIDSEIAKLLKKNAGAPTDFVFATRNGKPVNLRNIAQRWIAPLGEKIGVTRLTPYTLRHAVATQYARQGTPDKVTAEVLGHASTRMLKDVYQHAEADDKRAAAQAIGRLFKTRTPRKKKTS